MMGVDPQQLQVVQEITRRITAKLTTNYEDVTMTLVLLAPDDQAVATAESLIEQLSNQLVLQLSSFFGMVGEHTEVGKPPSKR